MKKLSIIIPCYNELENIRTIVKRVKQSSIQDKEIIIVDDCSTDGTREVLKNEIEPIVHKVIYHKKNRGKGGALNLPSLLKMDSFTSVEKTYNKREQANGLIVDGVVGYFIGIPVILCNNGTYDTDKNECKSYAVKRNALGYILQKNINIEVERESKLLADNIIASALYAVKLLETDGVVVLRKTTT